LFLTLVLEEPENNVEIEEDHIDINFNTSPIADVDDYFQHDIFDPRY
jgi:hypothetical protein